MERDTFYERILPVFDVPQTEDTAEFCKKYWPEETAHVLRTADEACKNSFQFDYPWDMERTWEPVSFGEEIDWHAIPFGDREFLWQFNRLRFLLCLAQAYRLTGDEKYAGHCVRLTLDWIDRAGPGENKDLGPWRTLETGIRAENLLRSAALLEGSKAADQSYTKRLEVCLEQHAARLAEQFDDHKYISNWGVLESSGLLLYSLAMREGEQRTAYRELALKRLSMAAQIQVMEDGAQWEQSPMYHNEVYQAFLNAIYYGERAGLVLPAIIREKARSMAYANVIWCKPDGAQFAQGDSDATSLKDMLSRGAWLFRDGCLKTLGCPVLDFDSAWYFGYPACAEYGELRVKELPFTSARLPVSGNYYFRSGWAEDDNLLHFKCGDTGGGHGHGDKLHVDLVLKGEDVLVDSGRYTYVDGPGRFAFKGAWGHNTVVVDGEDFAECETSWINKRLCTCIKREFWEGKSGCFVQGGHLGYLHRGVLANRGVVWIKPDIYVILDDFAAEGVHSYDTLYHFHAEGSTTLMDNIIVHEGKRMRAFLQCLPRAEKCVLEGCEQSSYYNQKKENRLYRESDVAEGCFHKITVINGGDKEGARPAGISTYPLFSTVHGKELSLEDGCVLRICVESREYILFLCYHEVVTPTDILRWENCIGYGKVVLFDRTGREKAERIAGEALAW